MFTFVHSELEMARSAGVTQVIADPVLSWATCVQVTGAAPQHPGPHTRPADIASSHGAPITSWILDAPGEDPSAGVADQHTTVVSDEDNFYSSTHNNY